MLESISYGDFIKALDKLLSGRVWKSKTFFFLKKSSLETAGSKNLYLEFKIYCFILYYYITIWSIQWQSKEMYKVFIWICHELPPTIWSGLYICLFKLHFLHFPFLLAIGILPLELASIFSLSTHLHTDIIALLPQYCRNINFTAKLHSLLLALIFAFNVYSVFCETS